jgi:hypothetical protein
MLEQRAADAVPLAAEGHIGVADQIDVAHRLDSHDADQRAVGLVAPERDPGGDLAIELAQRHVRLVPAIGWDDATICLGGSVDDREDRRSLVITARADAGHDANLRRRRDAAGPTKPQAVTWCGSQPPPCWRWSTATS